MPSGRLSEHAGLFWKETTQDRPPNFSVTDMDRYLVQFFIHAASSVGLRQVGDLRRTHTLNRGQSTRRRRERSFFLRGLRVRTIRQYDGDYYNCKLSAYPSWLSSTTLYSLGVPW